MEHQAKQGGIERVHFNITDINLMKCLTLYVIFAYRFSKIFALFLSEPYPIQTLVLFSKLILDPYDQINSDST